MLSAPASRILCLLSAMSPAIDAMLKLAFSDILLIASATLPSGVSYVFSSLTYRSSVFSRTITRSTGD
jgi:hypothetical protein